MSAYLVFSRLATTDQAELDVYNGAAGKTTEGHPVTPLAFYGPIQTLEGPNVEGAVILQFPSVAEARAWYDSPAYQAAREHRFKGADYHVFLVEGV